MQAEPVLTAETVSVVLQSHRIQTDFWVHLSLQEQVEHARPMQMRQVHRILFTQYQQAEQRGRLAPPV